MPGKHTALPEPVRHRRPGRLDRALPVMWGAAFGAMTASVSWSILWWLA